jgi:hypothetical protein
MKADKTKTMMVTPTQQTTATSLLVEETRSHPTSLQPELPVATGRGDCAIMVAVKLVTVTSFLRATRPGLKAGARAALGVNPP